MRNLLRLTYEGWQGVAFLVVVASLAPRPGVEEGGTSFLAGDENRPAVIDQRPILAMTTVPPPAPAVEEAPAPAAEAEESKPEDKPVEARRPPRLAIGFAPVDEKPADDAPAPGRDEPPAARDEAPAPDAVAPPAPDEPPPVRLGGGNFPFPQGLPPVIYRPFWARYLPRPMVIPVRPPIAAPAGAVPPPPRPRADLAMPRANPGRAPVRTSGTLDPHTIRMYWERDVEQFRALERAGYKTQQLRQVFGSRYTEVRTAASSGLPLSNIPPPPRAYIAALATGLAGLRP
jgi:hypothetical protein